MFDISTKYEIVIQYESPLFGTLYPRRNKLVSELWLHYSVYSNGSGGSGSSSSSSVPAVVVAISEGWIKIK